MDRKALFLPVPKPCVACSNHAGGTTLFPRICCRLTFSLERNPRKFLTNLPILLPIAAPLEAARKHERCDVASKRRDKGSGSIYNATCNKPSQMLMICDNRRV